MKKLVISPHVDDEVLGCGGILDKDSYVYFCGIDESRVAADPGHRISISERINELNAVAKSLGFTFSLNEDSKVNYYIIQDLISRIELIINRTRPDAIYLPHFGGYNQDHRVVFEAAMVALRPHDKNFFVKKILVYEGIHDFLWAPFEAFQPNYFVPIDIEQKISAYKLHVSQVRGMRSPEMIRDLASLRGAQAKVPFAEAFMILRWVD